MAVNDDEDTDEAVCRCRCQLSSPFVVSDDSCHLNSRLIPTDRSKHQMNEGVCPNSSSSSVLPRRHRHPAPDSVSMISTPTPTASAFSSRSTSPSHRRSAARSGNFECDEPSADSRCRDPTSSSFGCRRFSPSSSSSSTVSNLGFLAHRPSSLSWLLIALSCCLVAASQSTGVVLALPTQGGRGSLVFGERTSLKIPYSTRNAPVAPWVLRNKRNVSSSSPDSETSSSTPSVVVADPEGSEAASSALVKEGESKVEAEEAKSVGDEPPEKSSAVSERTGRSFAFANPLEPEYGEKFSTAKQTSSPPEKPESNSETSVSVVTSSSASQDSQRSSHLPKTISGGKPVLSGIVARIGGQVGRTSGSAPVIIKDSEVPEKPAGISVAEAMKAPPEDPETEATADQVASQDKEVVTSTAGKKEVVPAEAVEVSSTTSSAPQDIKPVVETSSEAPSPLMRLKGKTRAPLGRKPNPVDKLRNKQGSSESENEQSKGLTQHRINPRLLAALKSGGLRKPPVAISSSLPSEATSTVHRPETPAPVVGRPRIKIPLVKSLEDGLVPDIPRASKSVTSVLQRFRNRNELFKPRTGPTILERTRASIHNASLEAAGSSSTTEVPVEISSTTASTQATEASSTSATTISTTTTPVSTSAPATTPAAPSVATLESSSVAISNEPTLPPSTPSASDVPSTLSTPHNLKDWLLKVRKIGETKYIPSVNRTSNPRPHPQDQSNLLGVKPVTHHPPFHGLEAITGHGHPMNLRPGLHFQDHDESEQFFEVPKAGVPVTEYPKPEEGQNGEQGFKATQVLDDIRKQTNLTQVNDILNLLKNLLQHTSPKTISTQTSSAFEVGILGEVTTSTIQSVERISPTPNIKFGYDPVITTYNPRFSVPSSSTTVRISSTQDSGEVSQGDSQGGGAAVSDDFGLGFRFGNVPDPENNPNQGDLELPISAGGVSPESSTANLDNNFRSVSINPLFPWLEARDNFGSDFDLSGLSTRKPPEYIQPVTWRPRSSSTAHPALPNTEGIISDSGIVDENVYLSTYKPTDSGTVPQDGGKGQKLDHNIVGFETQPAEPVSTPASEEDEDYHLLLWPPVSILEKDSPGSKDPAQNSHQGPDIDVLRSKPEDDGFTVLIQSPKTDGTGTSPSLKKSSMDFVYPEQGDSRGSNRLKDGSGFTVPSGNPNLGREESAKETVGNSSTTTIYIIGIVGVIPAAGALAWAARSFVKRRKKRQPGETSGERLNGLVGGDSDRPGEDADSPISLGNRLVQHQNSFGSSNVTESQNNGVIRHGSDASNDFRPSDHRSLFKRASDVASGRGVLGNSRQNKWTPWEFPREKLKLLNVIGEGHFGQVWKAEAEGICGYEEICTVAVKTLKPGCASERDKRDLLRELILMEQMGPHPNIVTLLGACTQAEPYYLIMEYVIHGKLLTYLREARKKQSYYNLGKDTWSSIPPEAAQFMAGNSSQAPRGWPDHLIQSESGSWSDIQLPSGSGMDAGSDVLSSRDLTRFAYQISRGMEYLASKGIIHRDLAARNVLVDRNKICKIADFGLSRHVSSGDSEFYEQKTRGALPIRWMAPESLYLSIFTTKSDVWSFGVLLWEIVTLGSTPYPGMSAREVMRKVREGYRLERPKHCKSELYKLITRCWVHDPVKRPEFSELREELGNLLESHTGYVDLENFPCDEYYDLHDDARSTGEKI